MVRGIRDKDRKRLFTQRLFNRLMFIAFIQKKGWLQFGGKKNSDYLAALWADYRKNGDREMGFYYERLYNLFFHGLGAQDDVGLININRGGFWRELVGQVPYLNGGLFEEDEDDKDGGIKVPDEALHAVLHDLFEHFNFTVHKGMYVFCQAGRYQQLFLLDEKGEIVSRDVPRVLGAVKCAPDEPAQALPGGYNAAVMRGKRIFDEEVRQRGVERQHTLSLTLGQRYVMRELNLLRKNTVTGEALLKSLGRLYTRHNLQDWLDRVASQPNQDDYPRIVCSESLV